MNFESIMLSGVWQRNINTIYDLIYILNLNKYKQTTTKNRAHRYKRTNILVVASGFGEWSGELLLGGLQHFGHED